jgi:CheY-like chemotaxis protein
MRWDDEAGKALQRAAAYRPLLGPARAYVVAAHREKAITDHAASDIALLAETAEGADASDFLGQKAGNRLVGNARNIMLAAAELYAAAISGAVPQSRIALARRAGASLSVAGSAVEQFAEAASSDLARALRPLVAEGGRLPPRRILLVDDDPDIRAVAAAMLAEAGYDVVEADSGGTALDLLDDPNFRVALLIADTVMPGMSGVELAHEVCNRRPGMPVLFMAGFGGAALPDDQEIPGELLRKPFRAAELRAK